MRATGLLLLAAFGCAGDPGGDDVSDDTDAPEPPFVRPACEVSNTPIVPTYVPTREVIEGIDALWYLPEHPRAVIFAFHGGAGAVDELDGLHHQRIWQIFADADVGFVAGQSAGGMTGSWDYSETGDNVDLARMEQLRDHFVAAGRFGDDTPIWAWGFSAGGSFARTFVALADERGWPVRGGIVHNASWSRPTGLPAFFTTGVNDDNVVGAEASYDEHVAEGVLAAFHPQQEHAWTRDEMVVDPGYTPEQSSSVFDELVEVGFIDADGARLIELAGVEARFTNYESFSELPGPVRVTLQLRTAWAMHRVASEFACEERDFVLDDLGL